MMKRLLLGLMLLMTATAAMAEWTLSGESANYIQYVDKATIRRSCPDRVSVLPERLSSTGLLIPAARRNP